MAETRCQTDWKQAQEKAARTNRWAKTMTKVRIRRILARTSWRLVTFDGKLGGESRGIVDLLAIRRDHRDASPNYLRGDLFEIVLIQVKGGSARMPSPQDVQRLKRVGQRYRAKAVLLATWTKGNQARFFRLRKRVLPSCTPHEAWEVLRTPSEVFY